MFQKKITAEVLTPEEWQKLPKKVPADDMVRFTNNKTGEVVYVTLRESWRGDPDGNGVRDGEMRILNNELEEIDRISPLSLELGHVDVIDGIKGYRTNITRACIAVFNFPEGKLYEKALEVIADKRIGEYVQRCKARKEREKALKRQQKNSFASRFFR